jgi:Protein of unknown function (DUF5663)
MIRIDRGLLVDAGVSALPGNLADSTLRAVYAALETRVGVRLASKMTEEQLDEFEVYFDAGDDEGALAWLQRHFPSYPGVAREEYEMVKRDLARAGPWLAVVVID